MLGGVEEDLGDRDVVVAAAGHVVLHRVGVALDRVALGDRAVLRRRDGALRQLDARPRPRRPRLVGELALGDVGRGLLGGLVLELLGDLVGDDLGRVDGVDVGAPASPRAARSVAGLGRRSLGGATGAQALGPGPAALDAVAAGLRRRAGTAAAGGGLRLLAVLQHLEALVAQAGDDDGDVARALADARRPAAGAGPEAAQRRALVGVAGEHEQLVGVLLVVVHGVGDGAGEHLADVLGDVAGRELQHLVGAAHVEAADEVEDLAGLGGRAAQVLGGGLGGRTGRRRRAARPR